MKLFQYLYVFLFLIISTLTINSFAGTTTSIKSDYLITGLPKNILENAQQRLKNLHTQNPEQIEKEIILAIQPYGYFHAKVIHTALLRYHIILGNPVRITHLDIQIIGPGKNNLNIQKSLSNHFPLKINRIFTSPSYNRAQKIMFDLAYNNGYMQAKMIKHEIRINLEKNTASIFLTLDTGPLFYYGPLSFSTTPYNTNFLKRYVSFQEDQIYSPKAIQNLQEDLLNSKYFSSVTVKPQLDKSDNENRIPIVVDTQAVKSQQYNFGGGYGTNTGMRTSIGMNLYRVTDTGQHFSALLNLSTVTTSLTTQYFIPGKQPAINQYIIGTYLGAFNPDAGYAYTKKVFFGYDTKLNPLWSITSNLNALHERFSINNDPYHTTDLIYPSITFSRLSADNVINPEKGSRVTWDIAAGAPGIDEAFLQSEISGKWIYPPSKNNFVILRGNFGTTYAQDYSNKFPLSMRYFAGGFNSVRGYSYQSIGPGKYTKIASAEIQQRIVGDFYIGPFLDEGMASDTITQPMERGIGIDFVYRTSVGPLSIDIAQANTEPGKPLSIEFNFGANL